MICTPVKSCQNPSKKFLSYGVNVFLIVPLALYNMGKDISRVAMGHRISGKSGNFKTTCSIHGRSMNPIQNQGILVNLGNSIVLVPKMRC